MSEDRVFTDAELAERWHVSKRDVQDMFRAGRIHGFKVGGRGGRWRCRESVVIAYETGPPAAAGPTVAEFSSRKRRRAS